MRSPSSDVRNAAMGAGVGAVLALGLHLWMLYATNVSQMPAESSTILMVMAAVILALPISVPWSTGLDVLIPVEFQYPGLLLGIVVNWALLFWLRGWFRRRRAIA